jgi:hypothetical protein
LAALFQLLDFALSNLLSFSSACLIGFLIYTSASPFTPALFNVRLGDDRSKLILDLFLLLLFEFNLGLFRLCNE